jgi:cellulose synthase/poly-beta-1,6-N-acetylglucosamine synthase-like glycosyltransferase
MALWRKRNLLEIVQILKFLVLFSFAIPIFVFLLYGAILVYYSKQCKKQHINEFNGNVKYEPVVSIVTPTHNEEAIISKKIENLLASDYPKEKLEIIFVDDSDDSTPKIIQEYAKMFSNINLIKFDKRVGYSPCMIAGCKAARGEVIVLSDAGAFFDAKTVANLVRHFQNPDIGAVTSTDVILNVDEEVGRSEDLYQKIYNFVRTAETNMDSTFYFKGEASAVRKDLITDLEECGATFDTAVALSVRKKGYKTIYDPEAKFYEYAPKTRRERIRQKTTRAANWIKILFQFKSMLFNPKYGKFGLLTLPANFMMLVIIPLAILAGISFLIFLTFFDPAFTIILWSIIGAIFASSLIFSRHFLFNFLEFCYSLLKAIYEIIFAKRKHDLIEKIASTRR